MPEAKDPFEKLYTENLNLKARLKAARAELSGYRQGLADNRPLVRDALEMVERLTVEVERFRAMSDILGAKWKFGGKIDMDLDIFTDGLDPVTAVNLANIIREKYGNIPVIGAKTG